MHSRPGRWPLEAAKRLEARAHAVRSAGTLGRLRRHSAKTSDRVILVDKPKVCQRSVRFRYTGTAPVNLALLNAMETKMRKAAGARYLVNLDGAAYKACGLIYDRLPATLKAIHARADGPIPYCRFHADGLENDRQRICRLFQLPSNTPLWEIQANGNRLLALALSAHDGAPVRESICTDGKQIQCLFLKDDGSHTGMMKALCLAYRQNVSICQVLMEYQAQSS